MSTTLLSLAAGAGTSATALAPGELTFVLNSLFLLVCGTLVMLMAAGFTMLEAGAVRARSVSTLMFKNVTLYAVAGVMFYLCGYGILFGVPEGGVAGMPRIWSPAPLPDGAAGLPPYADSAFWFFQMVFVATAASVVSGCLAERIRLWPFLAFVAVLAGGLYPVTGAYHFGAGREVSGERAIAAGAVE